jgi:hypothetical protein
MKREAAHDSGVAVGESALDESGQRESNPRSQLGKQFWSNCVEP